MSNGYHNADRRGGDALTVEAELAWLAANPAELVLLDVSHMTGDGCQAQVEAAQVELARRKSAVQLSVRGSRQVVTEQRRATTRGNFGSAERRVTDPIRRKMALTPEDERN